MTRNAPSPRLDAGLAPRIARRGRRGRARGLAVHDVVLVLGALSAAALGAAACLDYGDPRSEARERAAAEVRSLGNEVRLAWSELRDSVAAPPGAAAPLEADLAAKEWLPATSSEGPTDATGLLDSLLSAAEASLDRGDARDALATAEDALLSARPTGTDAGRAHALAVRAATALGDADQVREHRTALAAAPEIPRVHGTSALLIARLTPPHDGPGALALLADRPSPMPAPVDRLRVEGGAARVELDPWWRAVQLTLARATDEDRAREAMDVEGRTRRAVGAWIREREVEPTPRWTLVESGDALVALRSAPPASDASALLTAVDRDALIEALGGAAAGRQSWHRIAAADPETADGIGVTLELEGTPLELRIAHLEPERGAAAALRRQSALRAGLSGLGLLVLFGALWSRRSMVRARRLAELRSTFVASVSHDLRTPIQGILLMAEALEQGETLGAADRETFQRQIRIEAERLRRQVEDLLDGARLDRGQVARVERASVSASAFFGDLERSMVERARAAGASLRFVTGRLPEIAHLDEDGVRRALWNLFENALLHGRAPDGSAEVEIRVEWEPEGDTLRIEVEDSGPGIPARFRETVFDPFERLTDREAKGGALVTDTGTGLGLAIVRAIARAHGGEATLAPQGQRGALFVLSIPAAEAPPTAA